MTSGNERLFLPARESNHSILNALRRVRNKLNILRCDDKDDGELYPAFPCNKNIS